jgi:hypothetical protein
MMPGVDNSTEFRPNGRRSCSGAVRMPCRVRITCGYTITLERDEGAIDQH